MNEKVSNIINYFVITILLFGTMFLTSRNFVQEYTLPKIYCFIISSFGLFLLQIFLKKESIKVDKLTLFILLYVAFLFLHFLFYPVKYLNWTILLCFLFLYFSLNQNDNINPVFINTSIAIVCLLQALYGLLQYFGLFYTPSTFPITGSFDNPAGFSACLSVGFPFVFELMKTNKRLRILGIISGVSIMIGIIVSDYSVVIICVLLILSIYTYHKFVKKRIRLKKLFISLLILIGSILFIFLIFIKKDSASGRLLIWEVTLNMIKDNPVVGSGGGSFSKDYMIYQADYLERYPNSQYSILADNVIHPFNEFLLLVVEYGMIGLFILVYCIAAALRNKKNILSPYFLCLLSIIVFSCFSYPFKYPFVWILLALSLARLSKDNKLVFSLKLNKLIKTGCMGVLIVGLFIVVKDFQFEYKWKKAVRLSSLGKTKSIINEYDNLYSDWNHNPLFLYNYGAELNHIKEYSKSIEILHECEDYFNDYDVQMLLADNYYNLEKLYESEKHYQLASNMCPNRFLPLYWMMKIYDKKEQHQKALKVAEIIMNKDIKIPSTTITRIKTEAKKRINH